jgi:hypothetical protein
MAIKTFTTGEVLTASDTNTYLANSGLVYVTSVTIGAGATSVSVPNAFNSTYDMYLIQMRVSSANAQFGLTLGLNGITTGYGFQGFYMVSGSATLNGYNTNSTTTWDIGPTDTAGGFVNITLCHPNQALAKSISYQSSASGGTKIGVYGMGYQNSTTTATAFTVNTPSGAYTLGGGSVTVYGYRKA